MSDYDETDYKEINKAINVLEFWGHDVGRIGGQMKEKFGSIRWYADVNGANSLHDLVKVGHVSFRWGAEDHFFLNWFNNLSKAYISPLSWFVFKYKCFMYGFSFYMACKKCPKIKADILSAADDDQYLFKKDREYINKKQEEWKALHEAKREQAKI